MRTARFLADAQGPYVTARSNGEKHVNAGKMSWELQKGLGESSNHGPKHSGGYHPQARNASAPASSGQQAWNSNDFPAENMFFPIATWSDSTNTCNFPVLRAAWKIWAHTIKIIELTPSPQ